MRLKFKQIYVQKNISFTSLAKTLNTFNIILKSLNLLITGIIQPSDFYQMYFVIHNFFLILQTMGFFNLYADLYNKNNINR